MSYRLLIALGAGLISAVVFASATIGPIPARATLFALVPLTLFLAGLGLGPIAAGVAGVAGTLIVLVAGNGVAALYFGGGLALPVGVLTYLASLNRQAPSGEVEWYPPGRLVIAVAILAGLFATLTIVLMGGDVETLRATVRATLSQLLTTQLEVVPDAPKLGPKEIDELTGVALVLLPAAIAAWQMIIVLLNFWLAGRITLASGHLRRPWPDLSAITYPPTAPLLLAVATAASFLPGLPGLIAAGFSGPLFFAYVLLGIAVVHYITRGSPWRLFQLCALYVALLLFYPVAPLAIALLGLAEAIWPMRKLSPPPDEPPST